MGRALTREPVAEQVANCKTLQIKVLQFKQVKTGSKSMKRRTSSASLNRRGCKTAALSELVRGWWGCIGAVDHHGDAGLHLC